MLWYKAWLETRWRFSIGLALLMCSAVMVVFTYPKVLALMPLVPPPDVGGELGQRIREAAELAREYRGYIWSEWYRDNGAHMATLFAVLLGTGGMTSQLFTLSLPASRQRLLAVRAATGIAQLFAMAFLPSLLLPLLSPAIGQHYGAASALVFSACLFITTAAFFSLALLLSTMFADVWRPIMIALAIAVGIGLAETIAGSDPRYSIFGAMSGESYFRSGALPWGGLLLSVAASAALLYSAGASFARRDF